MDLLLKIKSRTGIHTFPIRMLALLVDEGAYRPEPKASGFRHSGDK